MDRCGVVVAYVCFHLLNISDQGVEKYVEMKRAAMCEPWRNPQKLKDRNTNMIVALPLKIMRGNLKEYCGKEIIARYKGKTVRDLVAWDGCVKCDENVSQSAHISPPSTRLFPLSSTEVLAFCIGRSGLLLDCLWSDRWRAELPRWPTRRSDLYVTHT